MSSIDTIWLVDDDPIYVFLTRKILQKIGFEGIVLEFKNGKTAFDELKVLNTKEKKFPQVILLDINMPVWDGWNFLEAFSTNSSACHKISIYIVTSSENPDDIHKADEYNSIKGFIVKPLVQDKLEKLLKEEEEEPK